MENLENLLKSYIGKYCKNKDDSKNFMTKEQIASLKGRKDRIIKITEKMKKIIVEVITIFKNDIEKYLGEDINVFICNLNNMDRCIYNMQKEVENICNESNRFTCEACKSFHRLQVDNHFFIMYLQFLSINIAEATKICIEFDEYYKNLTVIPGLIEKMNNLVILFELTEQYKELTTQIIGLQRLIVTKPYCIHISKERREELINSIDNYERSNGIG